MIVLRVAITLILIYHAYAAQRPNIILLLTDDQDVLLGGIEKMPNLQKLLVEKGTTFHNAFVHTPICCPSRSSILTGKYLHNLRVTNNSVSGNCYGSDWREYSEQQTYATFSKEAGYQTSYAGKYLNQYGYTQNVPPGWDNFFGLVGNSCYYNYTIIESNDVNGPSKTVFHGDDYKSDYLPDLLANHTLKVLRNFTTSQQPFLHVLAWPTAHAPFTPAPQYEGAFESLKAPRTPNWNASCGDTKHWLVRQMQAIDDATENRIDDIYRRRLETLLSVDENIRLIVSLLESTGTLENTVIMYTSDNGFQLGQHRIADDKRQLYEHDIRVPFIVRGPMFGSGVTSDEIVLNIDIAPTIVELATGGQRHLRNMDGLSFAPCRIHERSDFLVSYHGEGASPCGWYYQCPKPDIVHGGDSWNNTYHCVRTISREENSVYCEFVDDENFVEYYDMKDDQWQLTNTQLNQCQKRHYQQRLAQLKSCSGETCRRRVDQELEMCT
jgi:N-acetylglucosamine-6-sulfatase